MKKIQIDLRLVYEVEGETPRPGVLECNLLSRLTFGDHGLNFNTIGQALKLKTAEVLNAKEG